MEQVECNLYVKLINKHPNKSEAQILVLFLVHVWSGIWYPRIYFCSRSTINYITRMNYESGIQG